MEIINERINQYRDLIADYEPEYCDYCLYTAKSWLDNGGGICTTNDDCEYCNNDRQRENCSELKQLKELMEIIDFLLFKINNKNNK